MAEGEGQVPEQEEEEVDEKCLGYKPPEKKTLEEIMKQDAEDESLVKYKQALLGGGGGKEPIIIDESNPNKVILLKMSICVEGRPDKEIDLQDVTQLKNMKFTVKEGASYKLKIEFQCQRDIVCGLKLLNKVSKKGLLPLTSKLSHMAGSYGPGTKAQEFLTPAEQFPSGMPGRGVYKVKSCFTDDDETKFLDWEWQFEIKKDWED